MTLIPQGGNNLEGGQVPPCLANFQVTKVGVFGGGGGRVRTPVMAGWLKPKSGTAQRWLDSLRGFSFSSWALSAVMYPCSLPGRDDDGEPTPKGWSSLPQVRRHN